MVILDTNIFIDHLRQRGNLKTLLETVREKYKNEGLGLSAITVQELYTGKSMLDKDEQDYVLGIISPLTIFPYTFEVAQLAGEIARLRPVGFADAAIAATTITNQARLLTLNTKDFRGIKDLELL